MDKTTHDIRLANWKAIIERCQSRPQDQSAKQWLVANNVPEKQYYYWLRKIRKLSLENAPVPTGSLPTKPEQPVKFRKLEVQSPVSGMQAAVIVHLPQATIEVAQGTDQQTVEAVLLALRCIC